MIEEVTRLLVLRKSWKYLTFLCWTQQLVNGVAIRHCKANFIIKTYSTGERANDIDSADTAIGTNMQLQLRVFRVT